MMILLVLALVLVGAAGMRRFGRLSRRVIGPWRPGVGVLALIALFGAAGLAARGAVLEAGLLAVVGLVMAVIARRRPPHAAGPAGAATADEARRMLGVGPGADQAEIDAAFRRLMQRAHPDLGGTSGLAAQLNAARDALKRQA